MRKGHISHEKCCLGFFSLLTYYHPSTKLREGNVFTGVCQSFCPRGWVCLVPGPFWVGMPSHRSLPGGIPGTPSGRYMPRLTSSCGHRSSRYASYWNAFLFNSEMNLNELQFRKDFHCKTILHTRWCVWRRTLDYISSRMSLILDKCTHTIDMFPLEINCVISLKRFSLFADGVSTVPLLNITATAWSICSRT